MITLKDWLNLYRKGIDLFRLNDDSAVSAFVALKYNNLNDFAAELRVFFAGAETTTAPGNPAGNDRRATITPADVFNVVSFVDNWESLTWFEAAQIYNHKVERSVFERSVLLCAIHNAHVTRKQDIKTPDDFNPIAIERKAAEIKRLKLESGITPEIETKQLLNILGANK